MTADETAQRVREILCDQFGLPPDSAMPALDLTRLSDLAADSLDQIEAVSRLEDEFGVGIDDGRYRGMATVADAIAVICGLAENPDPCTAPARAQGCTCTMESVHSASIDPPEPIVSRSCPVHGDARDPSDVYKAARDDEAFFGPRDYDDGGD